jgi:VanZ family protein
MVKNDFDLKPGHRLNRSTPLFLRMAAWLAVLLWIVSICYLSSLSGTKVSSLNVVDLWDKAAHFLAFALGSALLACALRLNTAWLAFRVVLAAAAAISVFGGIDEWHQLYTPGRSGADLGDWIADTLGALSGASLVLLSYARPQRPNPKTAQGA